MLGISGSRSPKSQSSKDEQSIPKMTSSCKPLQLKPDRKWNWRNYSPQGSSTTCLRSNSTHSVVVSIAVLARASASTTLKIASRCRNTYHRHHKAQRLKCIHYIAPALISNLHNGMCVCVCVSASDFHLWDHYVDCLPPHPGFLQPCHSQVPGHNRSGFCPTRFTAEWVQPSLKCMVLVDTALGFHIKAINMLECNTAHMHIYHICTYSYCLQLSFTSKLSCGKWAASAWCEKGLLEHPGAGHLMRPSLRLLSPVLGTRGTQLTPQYDLSM